jgi:enoyl-CoA hydratase
MDARVRYECTDQVATLTMDDGKVNALSPGMLGELRAALDRAEADAAAVVLTGRPGLFSAGFDLRVLGAGGTGAADMLRAGFELSHRMLSYPYPLVIACSGHAIAMGAFLTLSGDHRIGLADGDFHVRANEVAIGLVMPRTAIEICRQRLTPAAFERAVLLAESFPHDAAVSAGFLDQLAPAADLQKVARSVAVAARALDMRAHAATKRRCRAATLDALWAAIELDDAEVRALL